MTHQYNLVDTRMFLKISRNVSIPIIRRNKTWSGRSIKVEGDSKEWDNITVIDSGPDADFPEEPLVTDEIRKAVYSGAKLESYDEFGAILRSFEDLHCYYL